MTDERKADELEEARSSRRRELANHEDVLELSLDIGKMLQTELEARFKYKDEHVTASDMLIDMAEFCERWENFFRTAAKVVVD
jgi:hypothetical protein